MKQQVKLTQRNDHLQLTVPYPSTKYLNACMRADCFEELHDLFKHAHAPAKEFTESYAALEHLRPHLNPDKMNYVFHIGDGAHCRTAALFTFFTKNTINISIDPNIQEDKVRSWELRWDVKRFITQKGKVEHFLDPLIDQLQAPGRRTFFTFVHSHVNSDVVLDSVPWTAAYINPCCQLSIQASNSPYICKKGEDWSILSPERFYQVLRNFDF